MDSNPKKNYVFLDIRTKVLKELKFSLTELFNYGLRSFVTALYQKKTIEKPFKKGLFVVQEH